MRNREKKYIELNIDKGNNEFDGANNAKWLFFDFKRKKCFLIEGGHGFRRATRGDESTPEGRCLLKVSKAGVTITCKKNEITVNGKKIEGTVNLNLMDVVEIGDYRYLITDETNLTEFEARRLIGKKVLLKTQKGAENRYLDVYEEIKVLKKELAEKVKARDYIADQIKQLAFWKKNIIVLENSDLEGQLIKARKEVVLAERKVDKGEVEFTHIEDVLRQRNLLSEKLKEKENRESMDKIEQEKEELKDKMVELQKMQEKIVQQG